MGRLLTLYSAVVGLCALEASALAIAEPTKRAIVAERDSIPAPTHLPQLFASFLEHEHDQLAKRADDTASVTSSSLTTTTTFTATIATDKTCGYISGSGGNPVTCANGQQCVWEEEFLHGIMCGLDGDAVIKVLCIDKTRAENTELCDELCQSNTYNLLCTETSAAFCRTYAYPNGVRDYRCASTQVRSIQSVLHTYSGQKFSGFSTTTFAELIENQSISSEPSTESSSTTTEEDPTTTLEPGPATSTAESSGGGTPLGAIIGGSIGGFVALAAVVILAIWLFRKKNKDKTTPTTPAPALATAPPPPPVQQFVPMQQTWIDPNSPTKSGMTSPVQSEWRQSTMTAPVSSVSPGTGYGWGNQSPPPQQFHNQHGPIAEMNAVPFQADPVEMSADAVRR